MATILVCDICGSKQNVKRCSWTIDRKTDAAGSADDVFVNVDLCLKCENRLLRQVIDSLIKDEIEFGKRMWSEYKRKTKF